MNNLTSSEQQRIDELLPKYKGNRLSRKEAEELKLLLERKKTEALNLGDLIIAIGIGFLIAGLIGYLLEDN